ncbi:hypothetical protein [Flavobacterium psychrophilum]|nr:hypothetical protein [Flavobacterium psychrophilum]
MTQKNTQLISQNIVVWALPQGSGYTLQSPEEKSGGFSLLSLTQNDV